MHLIKRRIAISVVNTILKAHGFFPLKRKILNWGGFQIGTESEVVGPISSKGILIIGSNVFIGANLTCHGQGTVEIEDNCDIEILCPSRAESIICGGLISKLPFFTMQQIIIAIISITIIYMGLILFSKHKKENDENCRNNQVGTFAILPCVFARPVQNVRNEEQQQYINKKIA